MTNLSRIHAMMKHDETALKLCYWTNFLVQDFTYVCGCIGEDINERAPNSSIFNDSSVGVGGFILWDRA